MTRIIFIAVIVSAAFLLNAQRLTFVDCGATAKNKVEDAIDWLKNHMSLIDDQMGRNNLTDWPGSSRSKFIKKLKKDLKIKCIDHRNTCQEAKSDGSILRGRVVPILHQRRIALCSNNLSTTADYVSVLAHEIGHLIRANVHRTKCEKKYEKPRFSQSVGLAAYHAYRGFDYDSSYYTPYCS